MRHRTNLLVIFIVKNIGEIQESWTNISKTKPAQLSRQKYKTCLVFRDTVTKGNPQLQYMSCISRHGL